MKFLLKNGKIILVLIILAAYGMVMPIKRIKKDFITIDYNQKYRKREEYYDQSLFF